MSCFWSIDTAGVIEITAPEVSLDICEAVKAEATAEEEEEEGSKVGVGVREVVRVCVVCGGCGGGELVVVRRRG